MKFFRFWPMKALLLGGVAFLGWHVGAQTTRPKAQNPNQSTSIARETISRPQYRINLNVDWELLTFQSSGEIRVPVAPGDAMRDVVFFVFANAGGVGGGDETKKHIAISEVTMGGAKVPYKLTGPLLRVQLPQAQRQAFALGVKWHGVVPRSPAGSGGIVEMLGGMSGDVGGLLGGLGGGAPQEKPKNVDYGLYTYGNNILSLGSFWYPSLAVRQNGQWIDAPPEGLGDVAYAVMSDYFVTVDAPQNVVVAAPGIKTANANAFTARNVRDFAILMSDNYIVQRKQADIGGRPVLLESYATKANAVKSAKALDITQNSLRAFSRRFGPYLYNRFVVAEGPMRAGAGGMEYSGMTAIASMLYQDWGKQLGQLASSLGGNIMGGEMGKFLGELDAEAFGETPQNKPQPNAPQNAPQPNDEVDNPAADLLQSTLGTQKQVLDTIFEATIAHEVAHQWWAIGVGSDSLRAPWLDESLTNYSSMIYFEDRYGRERAQQMMDLHLRQTYSMGRMLGNADAPVNKPTAAYVNNVQYGAIVYGKGALFYDALRQLVGDQVFFVSLREYYAKYSNELAGSGALLQIFQKNAPAKTTQIRALYSRWIESTHGDDDITGGKAVGLDDLLGGLLGGVTGTE